MAIEIAPYARGHEPLVRAFNQRLAEGGSPWTFFEEALPEWLPPGESLNTWRDFYVAVEDGTAVRGAYCLRSQGFLLRGEPVTAASIQGPISEGVIDKRHGTLAFHLVRDMEQRAGKVFAWGSSERMLALLRKLKWKEFRSPFLMRLVKVNRFLRLNGFLRNSPGRERALDMLAASGLGAVGARILQLGQSAARGGLWTPRATAVECARFGPWADDIWEAARGSYQFVAIRDQETLNAVLPGDRWPHAKILRMDEGGRTIGWVAVRDTAFAGDARFGDLRVGSIIDSLARPGAENKVIQAATRFLASTGVDAIVATYTHPAWVDAFKAAGFLASKGRRPFVVSPALAQILGPEDSVLAGTHLTPLDGDGPHGL